MGDDIQVRGATLDAIRSSLSRGRTEVEDSAGSAPSSIDAGDATAILNAMMSRAVEQAAAVSEALAVVDDQVGESGTDFWTQDQEAEDAMRGGR